MTVKVAAVTFDCTEPMAVARFWSAVLDRPIDPDPTDFAVTIGQGSLRTPAWFFLKVPEAKTAKSRIHVDLAADDRAAEVARAIVLGATHVADHAESGFVWSTLLDPEGHEFCVGTTDPA